MTGINQAEGEENEGNLPGKGSSSALALPLPFDQMSGFSEIAVIGENTSEVPGLGGETSAATFSLSLPLTPCDYKGYLI